MLWSEIGSHEEKKRGYIRENLQQIDEDISIDSPGYDTKVLDPVSLFGGIAQTTVQLYDLLRMLEAYVLE